MLSTYLKPSLRLLLVSVLIVNIIFAPAAMAKTPNGKKTPEDTACNDCPDDQTDPSGQTLAEGGQSYDDSGQTMADPQSTADGQTPAEESVCDGYGLEGKAWGLCNAYCEAMDCDDPSPKASEQACQRVLDNISKSNGQLPICIDSDNDGIPNETDECPDDPTNTCGVGATCYPTESPADPNYMQLEAPNQSGCADDSDCAVVGNWSETCATAGTPPVSSIEPAIYAAADSCVCEANQCVWAVCF